MAALAREARHPAPGERLDALATLFSVCSTAKNWRIPENTSEYSRWLADQIESRGRGISLSPTATLFVGMALRGYAERLDEQSALRLNFMITAVADDGLSELIAATASIEVAWAAFQAAIPTRPTCKIILHQGSRVIGQHPVGPLHRRDLG